jgi:hypothetical protein
MISPTLPRPPKVRNSAINMDRIFLLSHAAIGTYRTISATGLSSGAAI